MKNDLQPTLESTGEDGTKITLTLPDGRLSPDGIRRGIKGVTGVKMELDYAGQRNTYTFAKKYRYQMIRGLLNVYPSVKVITTSVIETSEDREVCNFSCVDAERELCVCGCDGKYHQGGYAAIAGWTSLGGGAVVNRETSVDYETEVHVYTNAEPPEDLPEPNSFGVLKDLLKESIPPGKRTRAEALLELERDFFATRKDHYFGQFFVDQEVNEETAKELQKASDDEPSDTKRD